MPPSRRVKSPTKSEDKPLGSEKSSKLIIEYLADFADWMIYEIPPGKPCIPMRVYVNLHKGTMFFYVLALMCYFDNFT